MRDFNGLGMSLGNLARLSKARSRSICAENPTGQKGRGGMAIEGTGARCARDLGQGWKVSPCVNVEAADTFALADVEGPGAGHYVGTAMAWGVNNSGWWGEGEIKFHLDGDGEFPTICGTGTEDYFGGACNWDVDGQYVAYSTPFLAMHQVLRPDGTYKSQQRFSMYRWHVMDPIRFRQDLRVTVQALGWRSGGRYLPLQDDIASVAFWYQTLPTAPFPALPDADYLEII